MDSAPAATPSTRPAVRISRPTYADVPALATAELLAFSSDNAFNKALAPHRAALRAAGTPLHEWPDFRGSVRRHSRAVYSPRVEFAAFVDGTPEAVGYALVTFSPPREREDRTWRDRFWRNVWYRAIDWLQLEDIFEGWDAAFFGKLMRAIGKVRKEAMGDAPYAALDLIFVHPSFQHAGVGSALLARVAALADAARLPLVLEASADGMPLYARRGYVRDPVHNCVIEHNGREYVLPFMVRKPVDGRDT